MIARLRRLASSSLEWAAVLINVAVVSSAAPWWARLPAGIGLALWATGTGSLIYWRWRLRRAEAERDRLNAEAVVREAEHAVELEYISALAHLPFEEQMAYFQSIRPEIVARWEPHSRAKYHFLMRHFGKR